MTLHQGTLLVFGIFFAVFVPVVVVTTVRRKKWHLIFDLAVVILWVAYVLLYLAPTPVIRNVPPFMYGLGLLLFVLLGANAFGFSRWLFNRRQAIPVERS